MISFYTSVGAPVVTIELSFVPTMLAGCGHYAVAASVSRLALFDVRYLSNETRDYGSVFAGKTDAAYSGIVEWHADGLPTA